MYNIINHYERFTRQKDKLQNKNKKKVIKGKMRKKKKMQRHETFSYKIPVFERLEKNEDTTMFSDLFCFDIKFIPRC